jgi:hypothetical protein
LLTPLIFYLKTLLLQYLQTGALAGIDWLSLATELFASSSRDHQEAAKMLIGDTVLDEGPTDFGKFSEADVSSTFNATFGSSNPGSQPGSAPWKGVS